MTVSKFKPLPAGGLLDCVDSIFMLPPARPAPGLLERVDYTLQYGG